MVRLNDAVQLEVTRHGERVKAASVRVRDLFDKGSSAGADFSFHYELNFQEKTYHVSQVVCKSSLTCGSYREVVQIL